MTKPPPSQQDQLAIMTVIERETETFFNFDFDGWAQCWVQDERTREMCGSAAAGITVLRGWSEIAPHIQEVLEIGKVCEMVRFERHNVDMTVTDGLAHVVFDGHSVLRDGRVERTFETRVLEKTDGVWRILFSSFVVRGHQWEDANRLAIDGQGQVICAPPHILEAVKTQLGLTVSQGRLRAARRDWDKVLQAALDCAASQHRYFQHYRQTREAGRNFRLPVVLGEKDEGGVAVCTLFVRDETTFLELHDDEALADRLYAARSVFNLSEAQMALACRIVAGDGLTQAAEMLKISVNTARTHLSRIYVKTGVNSQTALVRCLLSVG